MGERAVVFRRIWAGPVADLDLAQFDDLPQHMLASALERYAVTQVEARYGSLDAWRESRARHKHESAVDAAHRLSCTSMGASPQSSASSRKYEVPSLEECRDVVRQDRRPLLLQLITDSDVLQQQFKGGLMTIPRNPLPPIDWIVGDTLYLLDIELPIHASYVAKNMQRRKSIEWLPGKLHRGYRTWSLFDIEQRFGWCRWSELTPEERVECLDQLDRQAGGDIHAIAGRALQLEIRARSSNEEPVEDGMGQRLEAGVADESPKSPTFGVTRAGSGRVVPWTIDYPGRLIICMAGSAGWNDLSPGTMGTPDRDEPAEVRLRVIAQNPGRALRFAVGRTDGPPVEGDVEIEPDHFLQQFALILQAVRQEMDNRAGDSECKPDRVRAHQLLDDLITWTIEAQLSRSGQDAARVLHAPQAAADGAFELYQIGQRISLYERDSRLATSRAAQPSQQGLDLTAGQALSAHKDPVAVLDQAGDVGALPSENCGLTQEQQKLLERLVSFYPDSRPCRELAKLLSRSESATAGDMRVLRKWEKPGALAQSGQQGYSATPAGKELVERLRSSTFSPRAGSGGTA